MAPSWRLHPPIRNNFLSMQVPCCSIESLCSVATFPWLRGLINKSQCACSEAKKPLRVPTIRPPATLSPRHPNSKMAVPPSFIYHTILAVMISPFTTVCGHFLLACGLLCSPDTPPLVSVVRACSTYSRADYMNTYLASAISLVVFAVLWRFARYPEISMSVWYSAKIVAAPTGSLLMRLLPKLRTIHGSSLLNPSSMIIAALAGQIIIWCIIRLTSTTAFWRRINRLEA